MRLRGAISGEELGTVTVTSFDQLQNRCGRGVRFLDGAREIATQADLDSLDGVAELQVVVDTEAVARAAAVEALLECDPLDVASLVRQRTKAEVSVSAVNCRTKVRLLTARHCS